MESLTLTPSFSSYSSRRHTDTASRVVQEFRPQSCSDDAFYEDEYGIGPIDDLGVLDEDDDEDKDGDDEEEFEFAVVGRDFGSDSDPAAADDVFYNGQIRPRYPLFKTELVFGSGRQDAEVAVPPPPPPRLSLRKLFIEEREQGSSSTSCSSSEDAADELDGAQPESYCVWNPEMGAQARRKKSNSMGSSKRWSLRDFRRSFSDGKGNSGRFSRSKDEKREEKPVRVENPSAVAPEVVVVPSPQSDSKKDADRNWLKSSPDRQNLAGLISSFNGSSKNLRSR